jgi:hypothetical protein
MSAKGRGAERDLLERYDTPPWPVHRLLDRVHLPQKGRWIEPMAGNGAIRAAVQDHPYPGAGGEIEWTELDIAPRREGIVKADFFEWVWRSREAARAGAFDVFITNPIFSRALEVAVHGTRLAKVTALLVRLNWIEGAASQEPRRFAFLRETKPDLYVLPNRPHFTRDGKRLVHTETGKKLGNDATAYTWVVWHPECDGRWALLDETSPEERGVERARRGAA